MQDRHLGSKHCSWEEGGGVGGVCLRTLRCLRGRLRPTPGSCIRNLARALGRGGYILNLGLGAETLMVP